MASHPAPNRSVLLALAGWRPLWLLVPLVFAAAVPLARQALNPWPAGVSGVAIDTSGARASIEGDRFTVQLPLAVDNHSEAVIGRVSLWVEAFACPAGARPGHGCQRVLSTAQDVPMRLTPGASGSWSTRLGGALPDGLAAERIEVVRQLVGVEDNGDARRDSARSGL